MITINQIKEILKEVDKEVILSLEKRVDEKLMSRDVLIGGDKFIRVCLEGEYVKQIRDAVCEKYVKEGGFYNVTSTTSGEQGERAGLTTFTFYFEDHGHSRLRGG